MKITTGKVRRLIIIVLVGAFVLVSAYLFNPYQPCGNFAGSGLPTGSGERFVTTVVEAWLKEDYDFLRLIGWPDVVGELQTLGQPPSSRFEVQGLDAIAGHSWFLVTFSDGATYVVDIFGQWPSCPDFVVLDEELLSNIELMGIKESDH